MCLLLRKKKMESLLCVFASNITVYRKNKSVLVQVPRLRRPFVIQRQGPI